MVLGLILLAIVVLLALALIGAYNRRMAPRQSVDTASVSESAAVPPASGVPGLPTTAAAHGTWGGRADEPSGPWS
jgi:hypothetical protein